jgi:LacI family transcriptional regulator
MSDQPRARRATIADVAKAAGVSASTVDRVLNGRAPVRLDTAQRIQQIAEAVGFHAAGVIRERVQGKRARYTLGFLLEHPGLAFHRTLGSAIAQATEARTECVPQAQIEFMDDISPEAVSQRLRKLGERVDAVALVAADHALIGAEIERLQARGVPVFALISDLSSPGRAGYAGLDNRSVGRTAAWFITKLAREPGRVAIFVGSHRFQCQELAEMSFRSYVREHAPQFELLEPFVTLESNTLAEEGMRELLQRYPDIVGVFVAGDGTDGVLRALREHREAGGAPLVGVARELMDCTRDGLLRGDLVAVLSHPLQALADGLVGRMIDALDAPERPVPALQVPLETQTPESR